jgi:large subunit ribosomal protein L29
MSKVKEGLDRIRDLPDDELGQAHDRAREELFRLRLGNYTNQVENTVSLRFKRRELARILTIQRARELAIEAQSEGGRSTPESEDAEDEAPKTVAERARAVVNKSRSQVKAKAKASKPAAKAKPAKPAAKAKATTKAKPGAKSSKKKSGKE